MVEDMRRCYRACKPFLCTTFTEAERSGIVKEAKIEALKSMARTLFGLDLIDVKIQEERALGEELGFFDTLPVNLKNEIKNRNMNCNSNYW